MSFKIRDHLLQEGAQALAKSCGNFEDPLVPADDQHLARAVGHCRAAVAAALFFDLPSWH